MRKELIYAIWSCEALGSLQIDIASLPTKLACVRYCTVSILTSTYVCVQLFSLNLKKSRFRSQLTDAHLNPTSKVAAAQSLVADINMLNDFKFLRVAVLWINSKWKYWLYNYVQNCLALLKHKDVIMAQITKWVWHRCSKYIWIFM